MSEKTYSISELAVQLQLPRTTINDWLKNFAPYLEYEMKGKRKEFNRNALNVLKNISVWKNEGKSASAIQKLLEKSYGLCGEVSAENDTASEAVQNSESKDDSGELMQVVHSDLEMLLANVEQLNAKRIRSTRRAAWMTVIVMTLILTGVAAVGYFVYMNLQRIQQENSTAKKEYSRQLRELQTENKQQLDDLNKLRKIELDKLSSDFDIRNKKFQSEIATQKKELSKAFKKLEKSVAVQREAEMVKLRETFAAEQKETLEKLIAKEKELSTIRLQLKNLQQRTNSLQKKTESLNTMLEQERRDKKRLEEEYQTLNKIITSQTEED